MPRAVERLYENRLEGIELSEMELSFTPIPNQTLRLKKRARSSARKDR